MRVAAHAVLVRALMVFAVVLGLFATDSASADALRHTPMAARATNYDVASNSFEWTFAIGRANDTAARTSAGAPSASLMGEVSSPLSGVAAAETVDSALARASAAANRAADNVDSWSVSAKQLPDAGGRFSKWAAGADINNTVAGVLRSRGASFLPNVGNDSRFIVQEDLGTVVGAGGQTSVMVVVGYDGNVITAYPVK